MARPSQFSKQEEADFALNVGEVTNKGLRDVARRCISARLKTGYDTQIPERVAQELRRRARAALKKGKAK